MNVLLFVCFSINLLVCLCLQVIHAGRAPNIIIFLADDLGWNDVGFHNPHVKTPNIDQFAAEGVELNQSYVLHTCSPSRYAFLSGRYPFRDGIQHQPLWDSKPYCAALDVTFLPEALKKLGYATHLIGKWHLGFCHEDCLPTRRGFDTHYGFLGGFVNHLTHKRNRVVDFYDNKELVEGKNGTYMTHLLTERAIQIIQDHPPADPMFLVMSLDMPHSPVQVPQNYEDMFSHVSHSNRRKYLGMLNLMDEAVGNVTVHLKNRGLWDNSIVLFMSDNGVNPKYGGSNYPLRGAKLTIWEGGMRVPTVITGGLINKLDVRNDLFHVTDWFPSFLSMAENGLHNNAVSKGLDTIDGIDQSDLLLRGTRGLRNEFIYNLDTHSYKESAAGGHAAIRYGDYKLIWGFTGTGDFDMPYPWPKSPEMCPPCSVETKVVDDCSQPEPSEGLDPSVFNAAFLKMYPEAAKARFYTDTYLFNLKDDPTEKNEISVQYPELVELLKIRLLDLMREEAQAIWPCEDPSFIKHKTATGAIAPGWCQRQLLDAQRMVSQAAKTIPRHFYKVIQWHGLEH